MGKRTKSKKATTSTEHRKSEILEKTSSKKNPANVEVVSTLPPALHFPIDEALLVHQFDEQISIESSMPEEGIQSARDMYADILKAQIRLKKRIKLMSEKKNEFSEEESSCQKITAEDIAQIQKIETQNLRLKSLCEDLTKKKDALLAECEGKAASERADRQAKSDVLMEQVKEISRKLEDQGKMRLQQVEENDQLKASLRHHLDKYSADENRYNEQLQNYVNKIEDLTKKYESETLLCEKERQKCAKYEQQIKGLLEGERSLRAQVTEYGDRFEQFQEALNKSNDMFGSFKTRMEEMTQIIRRLEKENNALENKKLKCVKTIEDMKLETGSIETNLTRSEKQIQSLQSLIETLTSDIEDKTNRIAEVERSQSQSRPV
jgi:DNA repair exonuclease SbcCD ATPase subunit